MNEPRHAAYRDQVAAAYARIETLEAHAASLEAEARARGDLTVAEAEAHIARLEADARRWDRARTTLAILLGIATLVTMHFSERFGASVGVLVACVSMVSVGVTLAWPSLSPRPAVARNLAPRAAARPAPASTTVRVALTAPSSDDHPVVRAARSAESDAPPASHSTPSRRL
jgi:hypothetical protein